MEIGFTTARATDHLTRALHLPARGDEQDWEVELADADRLEEFLDRYPDFAGDDEIAFAMVALIIASFDDRVALRLNAFEGDYCELARKADFDTGALYSGRERVLWARIAGILKSRPELFQNLIRYWAQVEEMESAFASTLFFRAEFFEQRAF